MDVTKSNAIMRTKLDKIAKLSEQDSKIKFSKLMPHFTKENLISCFNELDGMKAVGVDGTTKEEYGENLEENILKLLEKMKNFSYRPKATKEVLIPQSDGKFRAISVSSLEDKIVQMMFTKILESIYEPLFSDCSYGFRRNRNAHGALRDMLEYLRFNNVKQVIDIDLENYFGTINRTKLMKMLSHRIEDKTFLRYISRLISVRKQTKNNSLESKMGLPQGLSISPVLANIYAYYIIDLWFKKVVPSHLVGQARIFRFCDDFIVCCTDTRDTGKLIRSLGKRLNKFDLKLNEEKTRIVNFNRYDFDRGKKQETFDFLGFTIFLSKAIKGGFTSIK